MVISHKYKCIFVHIPRTAGSSIAYQKDLFEITENRTHDFAANVRNTVSKRIWNKYFKFTFVRNPFDRFVSLYFYFSQMKEGHRWYNYNIPVLTETQTYENFEMFCKNFSNIKCKDNFHFISQYKWIIDNKENIIIDFVGRFESLHKDWKHVCERVGIEGFDDLSCQNKSYHEFYQRYYTEETKLIVSQIYRKDIEMFGYEF